jgi:hypothetical protein
MFYILEQMSDHHVLNIVVDEKLGALYIVVHKQLGAIIMFYAL